MDVPSITIEKVITVGTTVVWTVSEEVSYNVYHDSTETVEEKVSGIVSVWVSIMDPYDPTFGDQRVDEEIENIVIDYSVVHEEDWVNEHV